MPSSVDSIPLISSNWESVISEGIVMIQLWHIANSPTSFSNDLIQSSREGGVFILDISPYESLVAAAEELCHTVTIFSTNSSVLPLVIDTGVKILGLKITEDKIIALGNGKIVTWDLSERDNAFNTGNVQITTFQSYGDNETLWASIAPNFKYFAIGSNTKPGTN